MTFAREVYDTRPNDAVFTQYKVSPESRTVYPKSVHAFDGVVKNPENAVGKEPVVLYKDSSITIDFGFNTCGLISMELAASSDATLYASFTESKLFIDKNTSDRSMDFAIEDGLLEIPVKEGVYTLPDARQRGAFRYLTLWSTGEATFSNLLVYMNCMPSLNELSDYSGYFLSNDEFANKIWYAGAYTVQLLTIPLTTGRRNDAVMKNRTWTNDVRSGFGEEVLTDGAKRDRSVWSGDRVVSVPTEFLAFNSEATLTGMEWIMSEQRENGQFPYATTPIMVYASDTYHLWTLVSLHDCYKLTKGEGEKEWIKTFWGAWNKAVEWSWAKVDSTGTLKVSMPMDWGRHPLKGHQLSVNVVLYRVLKLTEELALEFGEKDAAKAAADRAALLKKSINDLLWDGDMYLDSDESTIKAQDGNSLAILFGVALKEQGDSISAGLRARLTEFGAPSPESPGMISPFISSLELWAHAEAGHMENALDLFRTMWGYIWNSPYGVQSSLIEGYFEDGSCKYPFQAYDPAYISHAHPWATGPTALFSFYHTGLQLASANHKKWELKPRGVYSKGALEFAQTGFTSKKTGFYAGGWKKVSADVLELAVKAPAGTLGTIGVPTDRKVQKITVNGKAYDVADAKKEDDHLFVAVDSEATSVVVTYDSI